MARGALPVLCIDCDPPIHFVAYLAEGMETWTLYSFLRMRETLQQEKNKNRLLAGQARASEKLDWSASLELDSASPWGTSEVVAVQFQLKTAYFHQWWTLNEDLYWMDCESFLNPDMSKLVEMVVEDNSVEDNHHRHRHHLVQHKDLG